MSTKINSFQEHCATNGGEGILGGGGRGKGSGDSGVTMGGSVVVSDKSTKRQHCHHDDDDDNDDDDEEGSALNCWGRLKRKIKLDMSDGDLSNHFDDRLRGETQCPNKNCGCLAVLYDPIARALVIKYLVWFERRSKYNQDSIIFEWLKYSTFIKGERSKSNSYWLPFIGDGIEDMDFILQLRNHSLCTRGMQLVLNVGHKRLASIRKASLYTAVLPSHKAMGKVNINAI